MSLNRFIEIQECWIDVVKEELKNGKKQSHWMWFVFPQLKGLGESINSEYYGIKDLEEAKEYYENEYLRKNLKDCLKILFRLRNFNRLQQCLGEIDTIKLRSCVTLFYLASKDNVFKKVIDRFYKGCLDEQTVLLLKRGS